MVVALNVVDIVEIYIQALYSTVQISYFIYVKISYKIQFAIFRKTIVLCKKCCLLQIALHFQHIFTILHGKQ